MSTPNAGAPAAASDAVVMTNGIGPRTVTTSRQTCAGCPALATKDWEFYGENDEIDRGTGGTCTASNKPISGYWSERTPTPDWCPAPKPTAAPAAPEPAAGGGREATPATVAECVELAGAIRREFGKLADAHGDVADDIDFTCDRVVVDVLKFLSVRALPRSILASAHGSADGEGLARQEYRERLAQAFYEADPFYELGEYVENHPVSPGGYLTWEQALLRDASLAGDKLFGPVTAKAYERADAFLSASASPAPAKEG